MRTGDRSKAHPVAAGPSSGFDTFGLDAGGQGFNPAFGGVGASFRSSGDGRAICFRSPGR